MFHVAMTAICVAVISWTVTQEEIFRELRAWVQSFVCENSSVVVKKLCYLVGCYYCFSHYVTLVIYPLYLVSGVEYSISTWFSYIINYFVIVFIANILLTFFHLLRAGLRYVQNKADLAYEDVRDQRAINSERRD